MYCKSQLHRKNRDHLQDSFSVILALRNRNLPMRIFQRALARAALTMVNSLSLRNPHVSSVTILCTMRMARINVSRENKKREKQNCQKFVK